MIIPIVLTGFAFLASPISVPDGAVAAIRTVELDSEIAIPRRAYDGAENPNPAAITLQTSSGSRELQEKLPPEVSFPLLWLTIDTHAGGWSTILVFEENVTAFSLVSTHESGECRFFDPRYKSFCEKMNELSRKKNVALDDDNQ